jgi:transposase
MSDAQAGVPALSLPVGTWSRNGHGALYRSGTPLGERVRVAIAVDLESKLYRYREISEKHSVSLGVVAKIASILQAERSLAALARGGANNTKYPAILHLLSAFVKLFPCSWLKEYAEALTRELGSSDHRDISLSTIHRTMKRLGITRKVIETTPKEKFTEANINYYGRFLAFLWPKSAYSLRFMDEAHFNRLDLNATHGYSQRGHPIRKTQYWGRGPPILNS